MKIATVKSSELGTNCWSPKRFVGECNKCHLYLDCTYAEKLVKEIKCEDCHYWPTGYCAPFKRIIKAPKKLHVCQFFKNS